MGSNLSAVLVSPVGREFEMAFTKLVSILLLAHCVAGVRKLRGNTASARNAKSLVNTFPFNAKGGTEDHHEHHDHHEAHQPSQSLDSRFARQGGEDVAVDFGAVAAAGPDADGKKCIDKVEMVEETEYDDVVQCDHSYDKRCHTTYVTNYESQQEEECEEDFRKSCFIEYESECWTKQEVHDVEDDVVECATEVEEKCEDETSGYTTNTKCSKWPKEVCSVSKKNVKKYTPITGCTKEPR